MNSLQLFGLFSHSSSIRTLLHSNCYLISHINLLLQLLDWVFDGVYLMHVQSSQVMSVYSICLIMDLFGRKVDYLLSLNFPNLSLSPPHRRNAQH